MRFLPLQVPHIPRCAVISAKNDLSIAVACLRCTRWRKSWLGTIMSQPRDPADIEWLKRWNIGSAEALFRDTWFGDDQLTRLNASLLEALLVRRHPMTLDILKAKVPPLVVEGLIAKLSGGGVHQCRAIIPGPRMNMLACPSAGPLPSSVGDVRAGGECQLGAT